LIVVTTIWLLFGAEFGFIVSTGSTYLLPLTMTSIGLVFGFTIPYLLYEPNRKIIFLWSQIVVTFLFCCLIIKVSFDALEAQREYDARKHKPENTIRKIVVE
jgi:hypothetical protein